jgi:hypothetical protein
MEIKYTNDKKGKAQSWDATSSLTEGNSWTNFEVHLEGSAVNEWSAKMNLVEAAEKLIGHLQTLCEEAKQNGA